MKWALCNTVGVSAWVIGLFYAKGAPLPTGNIFAANDHQFIIGVSCGTIGLAALLWTNLKSTA